MNILVPRTLEQALVAIFVAVVLAGYALSWAILRRLKQVHRQAWLQLGEPSMFFRMGASTHLRMMSYMWTGGYHQLRDRVLDRWFLMTKLANVVALTIIVLGLVVAWVEK